MQARITNRSYFFCGPAVVREIPVDPAVEVGTELTAFAERPRGGDGDCLSAVRQTAVDSPGDWQCGHLGPPQRVAVVRGSTATLRPSGQMEDSMGMRPV